MATTAVRRPHATIGRRPRSGLIWSVMNHTLTATLALGVATLTSCFYDPYYGAHPDHHPYHAQAYGDDRNYYRDGYDAGLSDHRETSSYLAGRHYQGIPGYARDEFNLGYSAGFASCR